MITRRILLQSLFLVKEAVFATAFNSQMDSFAEVNDSTDWLQTPLSKFAQVDTALRCQVCKDFFHNPVITSCSHTFCSICIRRCLSAEGKCPACRSTDQELKLRKNAVVQELVDSFNAARPSALEFARCAVRGPARQSLRDDTAPPVTKKRRIEPPGEEKEAKDGTNIRTRSQSRKPEQTPETSEAVVIEDSQDEDYEPGK